MSAAEGGGSARKPIALWVVPRSVSTAFERMMRARGDLEVFHEPFLAYYYYGHDRVNDNFNEGIEPDPSHHWSAIAKQILAAAAKGPVFFKDMAYYLRKCMSPELVGSFQNTFLIRDPRRSLPSLYGMQPNATLEEAGFEQQLRLMKLVRELEPDRPLVVVDAEQLKRDPEPVVRSYCEQVGLEFMPEALEWEPGSPSSEWKPWERWHSGAMSSTSFSERPEGSGERGEVPPEVMDRCLELYDEIVALAQSST